MNYLLDDCESKRLLYRKIRISDYKDWLPFFENPATSEHWIGEKETPEKACATWYETQFRRYADGRGGMNAIIEKSTGLLVGHCGLLLQTVDNSEELEIAYSLLPKFWNQGYATEASATCKAFAFNHQLAVSLISIISLSNIPSQKVAIKNGMRIDKTTVYKNNEVFIFRVNNG